MAKALLVGEPREARGVASSDKAIERGLRVVGPVEDDLAVGGAGAVQPERTRHEGSVSKRQRFHDEPAGETIVLGIARTPTKLEQPGVGPASVARIPLELLDDRRAPELARGNRLSIPL